MPDFVDPPEIQHSPICSGSLRPKPNVQKQIDSNEPNFWLEFNCDGDILNLSKDPAKKTFSLYAKAGCC